MSSTYSIWPIVLVPYNLPPWIGMKQNSFILSTIIPGEKSPGNDIDIYLQPLISELKQLWQGISSFDAGSKRNFTLRAALMWTINDFPAYAMLSGWSTKGKFACPCCAEQTSSTWLKHGKKFAYLSHRRWLPSNHVFRRQKHLFDGTEEVRSAPRRNSGSEVLAEVENMPQQFGKWVDEKNKGKRKKIQLTEAATDKSVIWKKKSIFFDLPYWQHNLLRHNLDVMHIEKNICDNIINTLMDLDKSKDNLQARQDLIEMGIRAQLHPQERENGSFTLPPACFTMSKKEKLTFLEVLKNIKLPAGYASNIARCVNIKECKIMGLKSHDCHVLLQAVLPVALLSCGPSKEVVGVIVEISNFLKGICAKVIDPKNLDQLQEKISVTLCHMERLFLPSFFTIMVHLLIHLVEEVRLGGPVQYRWMYPFERFFLTLKNYVCNRAHPEGSIAEGYISEEGIHFCSRYLDGGKHRGADTDCVEFSKKYKFSSGGQHIGKISTVTLSDTALLQAHRYVLRHCDEITPYREQFIIAEKRKRRRHSRLTEQEIQNLVNEQFHDWFRQQVMLSDDPAVSTELKALARGPSKIVKQYQGYIINGLKFHTIHRDQNKKTQNFGVVNTTEEGDFNYYGRLNNILEINYSDKFHVVLFKCDWANTTTTGMKKDEYGHRLVNFSRLIHTGIKLEDDPYVFSSQVDQVVYVQDPRNVNWSVVITYKPREIFDMGYQNLRNSETTSIETINDFLNSSDEPVYVRMTSLQDDSDAI